MTEAGIAAHAVSVSLPAGKPVAGRGGTAEVISFTRTPSRQEDSQ